ncbi:MAG: FAD-dependent oxidoreductase [Christensenellales bacterium]
MNTGSMSAKTACDVAVIGGGAAGMMAALQAAWVGGRVALLEKKRKTGQENLYHGQRTLQRDQRCGHR